MAQRTERTRQQQDAEYEAKDRAIFRAYELQQVTFPQVDVRARLKKLSMSAWKAPSLASVPALLATTFFRDEFLATRIYSRLPMT